MKRLKNDLLLIFEGLKEIHSIRSGFLALLTVRAVADALTPFVNIFMSALIIDGIAAEAGRKPLLLYALVAIAANLAVTLLTRLLNRLISLRRFEFEARYEMKLSQKIIAMDYTAVENPQTHRLREKINENRNMSGGGIWRMIDAFPALIQSLFSVIFSVTLTFSLFWTVGGEGLSGLYAAVASPLFSVILALGILANAMVSMLVNSRVTKKIQNIMDDIIPFNRIMGYYLDNYITTYHAGKDIRLFNQKGLIKEESTALYDDVNRVLNKVSGNKIKYAGMMNASAVIISTLVYLFVGLKALAGLFGVGSVVRYVGSIHEFIGGFTDFMTELARLRSNNEALGIYLHPDDT